MPSKRADVKSLFIFSIMLALAWIAFNDFIGYTWFTGLVKDVDFASLDYFTSRALIAVVLLAFYLVINFCFWFLWDFVRKHNMCGEEMGTRV